MYFSVMMSFSVGDAIAGFAVARAHAVQRRRCRRLVVRLERRLGDDQLRFVVRDDRLAERRVVGSARPDDLRDRRRHRVARRDVEPAEAALRVLAEIVGETRIVLRLHDVHERGPATRSRPNDVFWNCAHMLRSDVADECAVFQSFAGDADALPRFGQRARVLRVAQLLDLMQVDARLERVRGLDPLRRVAAVDQIVRQRVPCRRAPMSAIALSSSASRSAYTCICGSNFGVVFAPTASA